MYREIILDHYKHPRNFGTLKNPGGTSELYNQTCGDRIRVDIAFSGTGKKRIVKDIRFSGNGCAISQASASLLTERIKGKKTSDAEKLTLEDITEMLGTSLTPSRVKCAVLPLEVITGILRKRHA